MNILLERNISYNKVYLILHDEIYQRYDWGTLREVPSYLVKSKQW